MLIKKYRINLDFNHNMKQCLDFMFSTSWSWYFVSLNLLKSVKNLNKKIFTKSGIMVGLGETRDEIIQVMDDLDQLMLIF